MLKAGCARCLEMVYLLKSNNSVASVGSAFKRTQEVLVLEFLLVKFDLSSEDAPSSALSELE